MAEKFCAFDCETYLIMPGEFAPKCVSVSLYSDKAESLLLAEEGAEMVEKLLRSGYTLVGANVGFDISTLARTRPSLFGLFIDALLEGRVWCVQVAQKLIDIENGSRKFNRYSLGALTERFCDVELDKGEDSWRMRYAELDGVPVQQWPHEAKDYAQKDAQYTYEIFSYQNGYVDREQLKNRVQFDVALYAMSREGMHVEEKPFLELEERVLKALDEGTPTFVQKGFLKDRNAKQTGRVNPFTGVVSPPDYGKDIDGITKAVLSSYGLDPTEWSKDRAPNIVPKTPKGTVRVDSAALLETSDQYLHDFASYSKNLALKNKDLVFLRKGLESGFIHTHFDSLIDSGRTASRSPNLQNLSREPGVRECFVPREGYVYLDADYSSAELHTLAQICITLFGFSDLGDALNGGFDPHVMMAQRLAGVDSYEEMLEHENRKHFRQIAKAPNFALPGGMGPRGLTIYAKGMGIDLEEVGFPAPYLIEQWNEQWSEMAEYFRWVKRQLPNIALPCGSRRKRRTEFFTEAANYGFQGLAADGAGLAAWDLFLECYVNKSSVLFGSKPVMFVHDQFIVETKKTHNVQEKLEALCELMRKNFNKVVPDVPCGVEGEVKALWTK